MQTFALLASAAAVSAQVIPGEYIVQFKPSASKAKRTSAMAMHAPEDIIATFESEGFSGYAFKGSENRKMMIEEDSNVLLVEPNQVMRAFDCTNMRSQSWGLGRVAPAASSQEYRSVPNTSVTQYVLDTGINMSHNAFSGAGSDWGVDCNSGTCRANASPGSDRQGHGTHVAGTMAGTDYGVAPGGPLVTVKVLGDNGSGSTAGVIAGVNWTANNCRGKCVGNMSLGGGFSTALNNAVNAAVRDGVVMVVAAGNENQNACNVSPASAADAITVGSTTNTDARSSFSNWGNCLDIFAPGSSITSAWWNSNTATNTISGTSMASPHVAGIAAVAMESMSNPTPAAVLAELVANAESGVVTNAGNGSPNLLAKVRC